MITCSDAIEFLERQNDGSIDLILTDPPYNIGIRADWDKLEFDLDDFMKQARRVLSPTGQIIIFFDIWSAGKVRDALCASRIRHDKIAYLGKIQCGTI